MRSPNGKRDWNSNEEADSVASNILQPLDLVRRAAKRLEARHIEAPRLCAEHLLAHVLKRDRSALYRNRDPVSRESADRFNTLIERRLAHEPLQHLTGRTEFWSLPIRCDRRALIPRPETELCVRAVLDLLKDHARPVVADIGTGTGCIAIALAHELPAARILASDVSSEALALARENVRENGFAERIELLLGDLAEPFLEAGLATSLDVVVCNPPYVAEAEISTLQPEVRNHDPHPSLCGGTDGLLYYDRLFKELTPLVKRGGGLVLEMGDCQAERVRRLARNTAWQISRTTRDAADIDRVCVAKRIDNG